MFSKTKIRVSFPTIIFFATLFCINADIITFIPFFCALMHETGHIIVMKKCGIKVYEIKILPFGIDIKKQQSITSYKTDIFVGIAGIAVNMLLIFLSIFLPQNNITQTFVLSNLILIFINVLPIKTLDGGQILEKFIAYKSDIQTAEKIVSIASFICLLLVGSVSIWILLYSSYNFTLFLMCIYLFFGIFIK